MQWMELFVSLCIIVEYNAKAKYHVCLITSSVDEDYSQWDVHTYLFKGNCAHICYTHSSRSIYVQEKWLSTAVNAHKIFRE